MDFANNQNETTVEANHPHVKPLSAVLSQVQVAFTVEVDNQFEVRMLDLGHPGLRLSLILWFNLIRFFAGRDEISVRELAAAAGRHRDLVRAELGCLERWRVVVLRPAAESANGAPLIRDGWGSGRGIRDELRVRPTTTGRIAVDLWPDLLASTEQTWHSRFGTREIRQLRASAEAILRGREVELKDVPPNGTDFGDLSRLRLGTSPDTLPLPELLSRLLVAFTLEFNHNSPPSSMELCANTLRVLATGPQRVSDLALLTGCSPETCEIGWQLKPYVVAVHDPFGQRSKAVGLSAKGIEAYQRYMQLAEEIESGWESRFGPNDVRLLRTTLESMLTRRSDDGFLMSEGLVPPPGVARAGALVPALGRSDVGAAARKRTRDLVAQTEAFIQNPAEALPHYPLWDINRGFGP